MAKLPAPLRDLTIYLLKDTITDADAALRSRSRLRHFPIVVGSGQSAIGDLYVKPPKGRPPRWAALFEDHLDVNELGRVSSTSAVFLVKTQGRLLALAFGHGRSLLTPDCWEERFGLRVVLNTIAPDRLRSLDKLTFDSLSTHSRVQSSREGSAPEFGVDIEQDLVRAVTGSSSDDTVGKTLSGMDSLHSAVRVKVDGIKVLLRTYLAKSQDTRYKEHFSWVDHIAEVTDRSLLGRLDEKLVATINGSRERCWLCVPEIVDWGRIGGFRYAFGHRAPVHSDLNLDGFMESVTRGELSLALLKHRRAFQVDNEGTNVQEWSIYKCVYCELELDGSAYILSTGRWYRVDANFVQAVNDFFDRMCRYSIELPEYDDASEAAYCERVARLAPGSYALMDRKTVAVDGARGQVEFCDLFSATKDLIHIKRYAASSVLSHLFSQGLVSGEAFRSDPKFREDVLALLPPTHQIFDAQRVPETSEYQVVFAVLSDKRGSLTLPFFSRVNLRHASRRLEAFGYRTALAKIQVSEVRAKTKRYDSV